MARGFGGGGAQTAGTRPAFTIGRETTIVDGPVNADGTIDYVAAINELLSKSVTAENNAAIPLIEAADSARLDSVKNALQALGIPSGKSESALQSLSSIAQQQEPPPTDDALDAMENSASKTPWKKGEFPLMEKWLDKNAKSLSLVEEACKRPRFFVPWVSKEKPPSANGAIPLPSFVRDAAEPLLTRAMRRAGDGDLDGALDDLSRIRTLARLSEQEHTRPSYLIAEAIELTALGGYRSLTLTDNLTNDQLTKLHQSLLAMPPLPEPDDTTDLVEQMICLDGIMQIIRGQGRSLVSEMGGDAGDKSINMGDLPHADWDVMMKEVVRIGGQWDRVRKLPLRERLQYAQYTADWAAKAQAPTFNITVMPVFSSAAQPSGKEAVESFLKQRPNETRQAYSQRIGRWIVEGPAWMDKASVLIDVLPGLQWGMAVTAISLRQYRLAHGEYPQALKELGEPVLKDVYSGKDISYRRGGEGFVLWSVGMNQNDTSGTGNLAIRAER